MSRASRLLVWYRAVYRVVAAITRHSGPVAHWGRPIANLVDGFLRSRFKELASFPNPVLFSGHRFYWEGSSYSVQGMFFGTFEIDTVVVFKRMLRFGMGVVDVGAHIGCYTILAAEGVGPAGKVYAFEPDPRNADLLEHNVQCNGYEDRVKIIRKALSDSEGHHEFFPDRKDTGSSSLYKRSGSIDAPLDVETVTLDAFFAGEGWPPIGFVKMDIEGSEESALKGMAGLSARNPHLKLIVEFNTECMDAAKVCPEALLEVLRNLGFTRISLIAPNSRLQPIGGEIPRLVRKARGNPPNLLCEKLPVQKTT